VFDFSLSEIMVVGIVALLAIGPKDIPVTIRTIARVLKKFRGIAAEFQTQLDEMMRDTDLTDVQSSLRDLRGMNLGAALNKIADPDADIRAAMAGAPPPPHPGPPTAASSPGGEASTGGISQPASSYARPAFLPPISAFNRHVQPESV
jgi:sec-independent protein translocase protein TatB